MALIPNNESLVVGRGEVYFDRHVAGVGEGERYFGNTPSFQITRSITRQERKTSYGGKVYDIPGKVISEDISLKITTDAISWGNIREWFSQRDMAQNTIVGSELVPFTEQIRVRQGRWYQLGTQYSPMGTGMVDRVSGANADGGDSLRQGLDWTIDLTRGRIFIRVGSTRVPNNALINVTYFRRTSGQFLTEANAEEALGSIRYISRNPYGPQTDYYFPLVRISPQGALEMKGDEFQQMQFSASVMKLSPLTALAYASRSGAAPTAITADTTLITADTTLYTADNGAWENAQE